MHHYKYDLSNKHKKSFKSAALSSRYKSLTNSYPKHLILTLLCPCDIEY